MMDRNLVRETKQEIGKKKAHNIHEDILTSRHVSGSSQRLQKMISRNKVDRCNVLVLDQFVILKNSKKRICAAQQK